MAPWEGVGLFFMVTIVVMMPAVAVWRFRTFVMSIRRTGEYAGGEAGHHCYH